MSLFNRLPGFVRSPPGLEHRLLRRLPSIALWGTLLPLAAALMNRWMGNPNEGGESGWLLFDFLVAGVVVLHWHLVLTVALGCFIVRVMKGPAYVADAYPLPAEDPALEARPPAR